MTAKKRIDWGAIRARLSRSTDDAAEDGTRLEAVYRRRAAELAARREQVEDRADTIAVLAFRLGEERYGLPLTDLAGVLPLERLTPLPGSPAELLGVINHKGNICSVLDLARLLGLPAHERGAAYVLLLRGPGREVGLAVGPVEGVLRVQRGTSLGEESAGPYLETLTADRLRILSAGALLSHPVLSESPLP
jgi:purine-binding chemotaxis protein CheW